MNREELKKDLQDMAIQAFSLAIFAAGSKTTAQAAPAPEIQPNTIETTAPAAKTNSSSGLGFRLEPVNSAPSTAKTTSSPGFRLEPVASAPTQSTTAAPRTTAAATVAAAPRTAATFAAAPAQSNTVAEAPYGTPAWARQQGYIYDPALSRGLKGPEGNHSGYLGVYRKANYRGNPQNCPVMVLPNDPAYDSVDKTTAGSLKSKQKYAHDWYEKSYDTPEPRTRTGKAVHNIIRDVINIRRSR